MFMVFLRKEHGRSYKKLDRKYLPFKILQNINDDAYVLDLPKHIKIFKTFNVVDLNDYVLDNIEHLYPDENSRSNCFEVKGNDAGRIEEKILIQLEK